MIKLSFKDFTFETNGIISNAKITAVIKYFLNDKYIEVAHKEFRTKISIKPGDTKDLNKAYKYAEAKLEKDAYLWAVAEANNELLNIQKQFKIFNDFIIKSNHIIVHDVNYLSKF